MMRRGVLCAVLGGVLAARGVCAQEAALPSADVANGDAPNSDVPGGDAPGSAPAANLSPGALSEAQTYFKAGSEAYAAGQFLVAIEAFEQARRIDPRPAIAFAIAQAHRRQFFIDHKPEHVKRAVALYREYLATAEQGGKRLEAAEAIGELESIGVQLAPPANAAERQHATKLVVTSATRGARIRLDRAEPVLAPLIASVTPGPHVVEVSGAGYFDERRELVAVEGGLVAIDVSLRERPALLSVAAPAGTYIAIDGRVVAVAPLAAPIRVARGFHVVTVSKNGYEAWSSDGEFGAGAARSFHAELRQTTQRKIAYGLLGVGGAGIATGVFCFVAAWERERSAQRDASKFGSDDFTQQTFENYEAARTSRNEWRLAGYLSTGGGLLVAATGAWLYAFDQPEIDALSRPERRGPLLLSARSWRLVPTLDAAGGGLTLRARF